MPEASDHTSPGSPSASDRLLARRDEVLNRWVERTRAEIPAAANERHPVLVNTFPAVLRNLAEALSQKHPRALASDGTTYAQEHGGERVRLTGYLPSDVIREYQILREVVLKVLEESGPVTPTERSVVTRSIDQMILEAVTAFHLVHHKLREEFMLSLAHDLRGPLTAASTSAAFILRRPEGPDVARWASRVVDAVERADKMLRDLLDVSRLRAGGQIKLELAEFELTAVLQEVVAHLSSIHGDRFVVVAPGPIQGFWSAEALRRAVENLITNAVKYGDPRQPITITATAHHGRVTLRVHNRGSYIPVEQQEALFKTFQRGATAETSGQRGWGIGLSIVRGVVESHGGSVSVDSLPERGTTFILDFPVDARPYQQAPTTESH